VLPGATDTGAMSAGGVVTSAGIVVAGSSGATFYGLVASGIAVSGNATEYVLSNGVAIGGSVTSGSVFVYSGGLVSGITDNATVQVYSGGTTTDTLVTSAGYLELFGGANSVVTISSGGFVDFFGGSLDGVQIAGGQLEVDAVLGSAGANFVTGTAGEIYDDENTITAPISGFAAGDAIILDNLEFVSGGTTVSTTGDQVTVTTSAGSVQVDIVNASALDLAVGPSDYGAAELTAIACYGHGTLIATPIGARPVEMLAIGDLVLTAFGAHRAVRWIGKRSYAGRFLAANPAVQPIRFRSGSLGHGLPRRDLLVSPQHAMVLDGLLIPARCLVNGTTISEERGLDRVDYVHVELDTHDVLLAEGAPSESFLDDDSRGMFHNASEFTTLYPEAPEPRSFCAPRVTDGYQLVAIRRRLAAVAEQTARAA
jgi:hypothetical protein